MPHRNPQRRSHPQQPLPPGIIVIGPYRCATSFLSHVLSGKGVDFGPPHELYAADQWNPYGYFQRPDVLRANNDFIASAGHSVFSPADPDTLRERGDIGHLHLASLDWRYRSALWGIKDPRFCATAMCWYAAGLFGKHAGLIRIRREPLDSARSLLQHPELAAQLDEATLESALQVILRYDRLADQQLRQFPGLMLSLDFEDLIRETSAGKTGRCIIAIDRFIGRLTASAASADPLTAGCRKAPGIIRDRGRAGLFHVPARSGFSSK